MSTLEWYVVLMVATAVWVLLRLAFPPARIDKAKRNSDLSAIVGDNRWIAPVVLIVLVAAWPVFWGLKLYWLVTK